jgi:hypothetical protein
MEGHHSSPLVEHGLHTSEFLSQYWLELQSPSTSQQSISVSLHFVEGAPSQMMSLPEAEHPTHCFA